MLRAGRAQHRLTTPGGHTTTRRRERHRVVRHLTGERSRTVRAMSSRDSLRGHSEPRAPNAAVEEMLSLADVDDEAMRVARQHLARVSSRLGHQGATDLDLGVLGQAYIRAVGRVAAAEVETISSLVGARPSEKQDDYEAVLVGEALALGRETFHVLHGSMLRNAVRRRAMTSTTHPAADRPVAVAHVDVIGSTAMLAHASPCNTQRLVDGLFFSAQTAIRGRAVEATKYVGDGVFFVGSDRVDVVRSSLDCLRRLTDDFDLNARAGLAVGPVIRRAGDIFGLPVNLSHILTKSARPRTLLASAAAVESLPASMRSERKSLTVPGLSSRIDAIEIVDDLTSAAGWGG
jgi:class 3 adenylate cyclase